MKAINNTLILLLLTISFGMLASCDATNGDKVQRRHKSLLTPTSSGNPYEVLVVAEDSLWNGYAGEALRQVLERPIPMLPQEEPTFHVSHVNFSHYDRITNIFRNIIKLEVDQYSTEAHFSIQRDMFSTPQLILTVKGPTHQQISSFITEQTKFFIQYISAEELNRNAMLLEEQHNLKFNKMVKEMFGCEFYIPTDLNKIKKGKNFIWASNDGTNVIQSICIYSYPYATERVFTLDAYVKLRNKFMKDNIPGFKPNQYMTTTKGFVQVKDINVQDHYVQEARGLWEMANDMMGGPFIAHSQVDTINNMVVVVEGFVYAPDKMKRTMIRRLQSALYTLKLPTERLDTLSTSNKQDNEKN